MPLLKRLTSREILSIPGRFGFEVVSVKGSHAKLARSPLEGTGHKENIGCSSAQEDVCRHHSRNLQAGMPLHPGGGPAERFLFRLTGNWYKAQPPANCCDSVATILLHVFSACLLKDFNNVVRIRAWMVLCSVGVALPGDASRTSDRMNGSQERNMSQEEETIKTSTTPDIIETAIKQTERSPQSRQMLHAEPNVRGLGYRQYADEVEVEPADRQRFTELADQWEIETVFFVKFRAGE